VWEWNFAPDVRAVSNDPTVVELARHTTWYARRLTQGAMWIVEHDGRSVGVVRIDHAESDASISIALATAARGHGFGRHAIAAACAAWGRPVTAQVREDNQPSRAAFEACGFTATHTRDRVVTYQWRP
jgi:RimJ/RimL family protein N-acetyltransferase